MTIGLASYDAPTRIIVPTLITKRLVLRCWDPDDVTPYTAMNEDEESMRYQGGTFGREPTARLVTHLVGHWHLYGFGIWAVELLETGEFIGRAGLYGPEGWPGVEAAWSVRRDLWGRGLATEAGLATADFGFDGLGLQRLISVIEPGNDASVRVAEKLGMNYDRREDVGPWKDQLVYTISRDRWRELHPARPRYRWRAAAEAAAVLGPGPDDTG